MTYRMAEKQKLKFVFHNPNTMEETSKYLLEWYAKVCLPMIENLVIKQENIEEEGYIESKKIR